MPKGLVILLWYFGIFGAIPAPEGWTTLEGERFALHLPPGWVGSEVPPEEPLAGFEPVLHFAPSDARQRDRSLVLGLAHSADKIGTRDPAALLSLQVDRPGMFARALQRSLPGWTCSVVTTVFDQARHRLWFRIEARRKGQPPRAFVVVVFLTRAGGIYLQATFPAEDGDEEFLGQFQDIVNSFEIERIRLREPAGRWGANPSSTFRVGFDAGRGFGRRHPRLFLCALVLLGLGILLAVLDPLVFRRRLKATLLRRLQRSASLKRPFEPVEATRAPRRLWRPPLPWSLAWQVALAQLLAFGIVPWFVRTPQLYGVRLFTACYLLGYGLLAGAMALHYLPRSSRHLKYELLAAALSTLALPGTLSDPVLHASAIGLDLPSLQGFFWGAYLSQTFYFYLSGVIVQRLLRGAHAVRRASRFYRATYWLKRYLFGLVGASFWFPVAGGLGFGFVLLVAFYQMGEKAREHCILYLRSFHDSNTNRVLAKIIMPTAGRFAPVLAVAHTLQPPEELYRQTNLISAAQLTVLPDTAWKEWILASLPRCRAVLIDASVRSDGLLWELEQAQAILPPERIAVLAKEGDSWLAPAGLFTLIYRLDWRGRWAARKALRRWLKAMPPVASEGSSPEATGTDEPLEKRG